MVLDRTQGGWILWGCFECMNSSAVADDVDGDAGTGDGEEEEESEGDGGTEGFASQDFQMCSCGKKSSTITSTHPN